MYIQITERCNMHCDHCCMSATTKGRDMDEVLFIRALDLAVKYGELVTIGGGEPTVHPKFFQLLDRAVLYYEAKALSEPPLVITNGKRKKQALRLLDYVVVRERPLYVELSQDAHHEYIDPEVVAAYKRVAKEYAHKAYAYSHEPRQAGGVALRTVREILPVGRAKDTGVWTVERDDGSHCCCEDIFVKPDGSIWSCGCMHTQIGDLFGRHWLDDFDREYAHYGGRAPSALEDAQTVEAV